MKEVVIVPTELDKVYGIYYSVYYPYLTQSISIITFKDRKHFMQRMIYFTSCIQIGKHQIRQIPCLLTGCVIEKQYQVRNYKYIYMMISLLLIAFLFLVYYLVKTRIRNTTILWDKCISILCAWHGNFYYVFIRDRTYF